MGTVATDRRKAWRRPVSAIATVTAVKVGGDEVHGIDISATGILVESAQRLRPGTPSHVALMAGESSLPIAGRVVRCEVVSLGPIGPRYRTAIAFNAPVPELEQDPSTGAADAWTSFARFAGGVDADGGDLNQW